jgi:hypothetical protein
MLQYKPFAGSKVTSSGEDVIDQQNLSHLSAKPLPYKMSVDLIWPARAARMHCD